MQGDGGAIINISSTASVNKSPTSEPYGAAKAGLNGLDTIICSSLRTKSEGQLHYGRPFLTDIADAGTWRLSMSGHELLFPCSEGDSLMR